MWLHLCRGRISENRKRERRGWILNTHKTSREERKKQIGKEFNLYL